MKIIVKGKKMSMNLYLKVHGRNIPLPQTTTKETSKILGFDVDKEVDNKGFSTGRKVFFKQENINFRSESLKPIKDPSDFNNCFIRFKEYALEYTNRCHSVDNDAVKAVLEIQKAIDKSYLKTPQIFFYYL